MIDCLPSWPKEAQEQEAIYRALAESLGKPDMLDDDDAWYDEAEDGLAAYDRGEISSVTLDEIAARKRL